MFPSLMEGKIEMELTPGVKPKSTYQFSNDHDTSTHVSTETGSPCPVGRISLIYACQFHVKPEILNYYYPAPHASLEYGKPILEGSSVFDGPYDTKWQVTTTFIRWIEVTRWVSLYLTRIDKTSTPDFYIQCEFRIVDKNRNVLKSMRNQMTKAMEGGQTRGFTKFMRFSEIGKVMTEDNLLNVEAHINFIYTLTLENPLTNNKVEVQEAPQITEPEDKKANHEDEQTLEGYILNKQSLCIPSIVEYIEEDDQVEIWYNDELLAHSSRKLLREHSALYEESLDKWWQRIDFHVTYFKTSQRVVEQMLQFLINGNCEYFQEGSYDDVFQLFNFAQSMRMDRLMSACLNELYIRVTPENAALLFVSFMNSHWLVIEDTKEKFRSYARSNFRAIRESEMAKTFFDVDAEFEDTFLRLALEPEFSFASHEDGSSNGSPRSGEDIWEDMDTSD